MLSDTGGWGRVRYRNTKTGQPRELPLHPEVQADLRAVMDPIPLDPAARLEWEQRPIFRKRGSLRHWDQSSYLKAWRATLAKSVTDHPELAGMWLRHFRNAFKTVLTDAGVPTELIEAMMGHAGGVASGYYEGRWSQMCHAMGCLSLEHSGRVSSRVSDSQAAEAR